MNATLHLRQEDTGQVVTIRVEWPYERHLWVEGNFSCDCNRAILWHAEIGRPEPDNSPCGYVAYTIVSVVMDDGSQPEPFE